MNSNLVHWITRLRPWSYWLNVECPIITLKYPYFAYSWYWMPMPMYKRAKMLVGHMWLWSLQISSRSINPTGWQLNRQIWCKLYTTMLYSINIATRRWAIHSSASDQVSDSIVPVFVHLFHAKLIRCLHTITLSQQSDSLPNRTWYFQSRTPYITCIFKGRIKQSLQSDVLISRIFWRWSGKARYQYAKKEHCRFLGFFSQSTKPEKEQLHAIPS